MNPEEKSRLRYVLDHISIAPDRVDYLLHTCEKEKMTSDYKRHMEALWNSSDFSKTISDIRKELQC
jgi:hypothetical protein